MPATGATAEANDPARVEAAESPLVLREPEDSSRERAAGGGGGGGLACATSPALGGPSVPEGRPPVAATANLSARISRAKASVTILAATSSGQPDLRAA